MLINYYKFFKFLKVSNVCNYCRIVGNKALDCYYENNYNSYNVGD